MQAAADRVGPHITDRLHWLLRFRGENLSALRPEAVQQRGWEILAFAAGLTRSPEFWRANPVSLPDVPQRKDIQVLQKTLSDRLAGVFEHDETWHLEPAISRIELSRWPEKMVDLRTGQGFPTAKGSGGSPIDVRYHVGWPAAFWLAVASTLSAGSWWLRRCRHCGSVFLGIKRQVYCQASCSQVVRTTKYRRSRRTATAHATERGSRSDEKNRTQGPAAREGGA
jgi:hypothetical protein